MIMPFEFDPPNIVGASVVVPAGLTQKDALFAFYATTFCFPDYFGYNWDALFECLLDLQDWHSKEKCFSIIHQDIPLASDINEAMKYIKVLSVVLVEPNSLIQQVSFRSADHEIVQSLFCNFGFELV